MPSKTLKNATKKRPDSNYNKAQLRKGTKTELEHTNIKSVAKEIAKDHLDEYPNYYIALSKMERLLQKQSRISAKKSKKKKNRNKRKK